MRLLKRNDKGDFVFSPILHDPPPYVILSHTWSTTPNAEVSYQDILSGTAKEKESFAKLQFIAERAKAENIEHFWVDNCCIDKRNEAEVAASIRSMYRWYQNSAVCFVYLADVSLNKRDHSGQQAWEASFRNCRWFKRGWTLQELIAPIRVEFYARERYLGSRASLCQRIHEITGIHRGALEGKSHEEFAIETRLRWATGRETTIPEDLVYALMGLCNVVMSPKYGEGKDSAEMRLKKKIARYHGDAIFDPIIQPEPRHQVSENGQIGREIQRREKLEILRFDMIDSRRNDISKALRQTCNWILTHPTYLSWRNIEVAKEHSGFFWVKGKPGAGKSVLVKHLDTYISRTKRQQDICLSFYFHARGEQLEKSLEGMYRSLLVQLLEVEEELQSVLDNPRQVSSDSQFSLTKLSRLFLAAVMKLKDRHLYCFIDALDECKDSDMQQMINFFRDLCDEATEVGIRLNVCFASRHYPALDIPTELQIVLEDAEEHQEDLSKYVRSQKFSSGTWAQATAIPPSVQNDILRKANGVFLWVVLVVEILKREFLGGRIFAVKKRLNEIPQDLSTLFQDIVQRDKQNLDEFVLCLRWILYAKRPLTLREFYFAMMAGIEDSTLKWTPELLDDFMHSFLRSSSKGLAELTKGKIPRAQFIHESVRDFLITEKGFGYINPNFDSSSCEAHEALKQCCIRGMDVNTEECPKWIASTTASSEKVEQGEQVRRPAAIRELFPFLDYATNFILNHADQAAPQIPQDDFLRMFDVQVWRDKANSVQHHIINLYSPDITLPYLLAERDCANLIDLQARMGVQSEWKTRSRHGTPLIAALAMKSYNAARVLLEQEGADDPDSVIQEISSQNKGRVAFDLPKTTHVWSWAAGQGFNELAMHFLRHDSSVKDLTIALAEASVRGYKSLVRLMLEQGIATDAPVHLGPQITARLSTPLQSGIGGVPLVLASSQGNIELVKLLLEFKPYQHLVDDDALVTAAGYGHHELVRLLLEHGAKANPSGGQPLRRALRGRHIQTAKLLLDHGATDTKQRDCFTHAAQYHHDEELKLIIGHDADTKAGGTQLLQLAVDIGDVKTVELLIAHGAEIEDGATQLHQSASQSGHAMWKLLMEHRAEVVKLLMKHRASTKPVQILLLRFASAGGHIELLKHLIENGADIKAEETLLLQSASRGGYTKLVKLLIEHGADVNAQMFAGGSVLHSAAHEGDIEQVQLLLENGAEVNARGDHYGNALQIASHGAKLEIVKMLLEHGANVKSTAGYYGSALQAASYGASVEIVKLLLDHGADVNTRGGPYGSALQAAATRHIGVVKLLLDHGADVNAHGGEYGNALQAAARWNVEIVKLLLERGADVNAEGDAYYGGNPLGAALKCGRWDIAQVLQEHGAVNHELQHNPGS